MPHRHTDRISSGLNLGPIHPIRVVEPCQAQVRPLDCTEEPTPYDEYLKEQNRTDDTFELTGPVEQPIYTKPVHTAEHQSAESERVDHDRPAKRFEPLDINEEIRREIVVQYEIPSDKLTGRLIDVLL